MSVAKLMSRIVACDDFLDNSVAPESGNLASFKHRQTFGIASDPLTLFACAFSALIHDAEHPGVPNAQLAKEGTDLAKQYNNRSVAEQNSVHIAWDLLMMDRFTALREAICPNDTVMARFRQLVVNGVMATDIMDPDLKALRNQRWDTAFSDEDKDESLAKTRNRKATIVIEHLIQASDVAHTMQ